MLIRDLLRRPGHSFSFEFSPPATEEGFESLYATMGELRRLNPAFVSVTYGAGGSTRRRTVEIVARAKHELGLEAMAHLTCAGSTREEIAQVLDQVRDLGIENVLALRGDPPRGENAFAPTPGGFAHADELVAFIRAGYSFCIGVAGYPEVHQEAPNAVADLENLKRKVDAGADFIVTQLFFDNGAYFDFVARAAGAGIAVPIIPGIMPVLNVGQIKRMTRMCGAAIPDKMLSDLEALQDYPEAVRQYGVDHSTRQCQELLVNGAPGVHFYTLNRSRSTWQILENLTRSGAALPQAHGGAPPPA